MTFNLINVANAVSAVSLGDQCFYYQTCTHTDQNADCVQIKHNAICQCKKGYHSVTVQKPIKRVFCSQGKRYLPSCWGIFLPAPNGNAQVCSRFGGDSDRSVNASWSSYRACHIYCSHLFRPQALCRFKTQALCQY